MIKTGMVSVTFRQFDVDEVIRRTKEAGLMAIEWGGDVHVPHGDLDKARYTADKMRENGLEIASYGSYYRALEDETFEDILATAKALGAPNIRIWAGEREPQDCDREQRARTVQRIRDAARMAARENITVSTEYHGGTLTVMQDSAVALLKEAEEPNLYTYWQPLGDRPWANTRDR
ncbi:MAG: sugar phosphate isomerase/epimerase family protein [Bianqueaceae bacterium]